MDPVAMNRGVATAAKKEGHHNELESFGPTQVLTSRHEAFHASFLKARTFKLTAIAPHIVGPAGCTTSVCVSLHYQPSNTSIPLADRRCLSNVKSLATWEGKSTTSELWQLRWLVFVYAPLVQPRGWRRSTAYSISKPAFPTSLTT